MMSFPVIAVERYFSIRQPFEKDRHLLRVNTLSGEVNTVNLLITTLDFSYLLSPQRFNVVYGNRILRPFHLFLPRHHPILLLRHCGVEEKRGFSLPQDLLPYAACGTDMSNHYR